MFRRLILASALVAVPIAAIGGAGSASASASGCWASGGGLSTIASCTNLSNPGVDWFRAGETCYSAGIGFVNFYGQYVNYANFQSQTPSCNGMSVTSRFNQHS